MKKIFNDILVLLTELVKTRVDIVRLKILEFISATIATTFTILVSFFVIGMGIFFSSLALSFYLGKLLESNFLGFILVGGGYLLVGIVLVLVSSRRKKPFFISYIIRNLAHLIYENKDKES